MNICHKHWDELRKSISQLGLDHLIAADGKSAAKKLGSQTAENFDPLLCAWQMIVGNAASAGVLGCFPCYGEEHAKTCDKAPEEFCAGRVGYINLAVRDTRAEAIRLGYRPREMS